MKTSPTRPQKPAPTDGQLLDQATDAVIAASGLAVVLLTLATVVVG